MKEGEETVLVSLCEWTFQSWLERGGRKERKEEGEERRTQRKTIMKDRENKRRGKGKNRQKDRENRVKSGIRHVKRFKGQVKKNSTKQRKRTIFSRLPWLQNRIFYLCKESIVCNSSVFKRGL